MTVTTNTTGATDRSSIVRGDVSFISGDWAASADGGSAAIVTGASTILAYGVNTEKSAGSTEVKTIANYNTAGASAPGTIRVIDVPHDAHGDYWAICRV